MGLKKVDAKIRNQLTCNRIHHLKADVDRFYLPRSNSGRSMIQLELNLSKGLYKDLAAIQDWMLQL